MTARDKMKQAADTVAEETKSAAKDASDAIRSEAQVQAEAAKKSVAGEVSSVASALRTASDEMRKGSPQERAMGQIASTLADVSDSIRDQDLGQMVSAANDFARRHPVAFLSSAAFLGFAAARFAKSSGSSTESQTVQDAPVSSPAHRTGGTAGYASGTNQGDGGKV